MVHFCSLHPAAHLPHSVLELLRLPKRHMCLDAIPPDSSHIAQPSPDAGMLHLLYDPAARGISEPFRVLLNDLAELDYLRMETGLILCRHGRSEVEREELGHRSRKTARDRRGRKRLEARMVDGGAAIDDGADAPDEWPVGVAGDEFLVRFDRVPICADPWSATCRVTLEGGAVGSGQHLPTRSWTSLSFSIRRPQKTRWKPSCCEMVFSMCWKAWAALEEGSSTVAPALKVMTAISVAGSDILADRRGCSRLGLGRCVMSVERAGIYALIKVRIFRVPELGC